MTTTTATATATATTMKCHRRRHRHRRQIVRVDLNIFARSFLLSLPKFASRRPAPRSTQPSFSTTPTRTERNENIKFSFAAYVTRNLINRIQSNSDQIISTGCSWQAQSVSLPRALSELANLLARVRRALPEPDGKTPSRPAREQQQISRTLDRSLARVA